MAKILLVFIAPVTFTVHDMWTIEHVNPAHDPNPKQLEGK